MNTVHENLNVLLGQLKLTTQEFNNIKTAVATALNNMKTSFKGVQEHTNELTISGRNPMPIDGYQNFDDSATNAKSTDSLFGSVSN